MGDFNPWDVDSLEAFACFKCPECDFDAKFEGPFQNHAVENHPLSFVFFGLKPKIKQLKKEEVENCVESSLIKTELRDVEINSPLLRGAEINSTINSDAEISSTMKSNAGCNSTIICGR